MTHGPFDEISRRTLAHYEGRAEDFWLGTKDHDVSQNIEALLAALGSRPGLDILDFGCGPGRDLQTFARLGHRPVGLDGAAPFVQMARQHSGCEVWQQDFLRLDLPVARFDGVFANATLFHVPSAALADVLGQLHRCLRPGGVLFSSNPLGDGAEGWNAERYGAWHDLPGWRRDLVAAGFVEL